jgi:hypothetical protein
MCVLCNTRPPDMVSHVLPATPAEHATRAVAAVGIDANGRLVGGILAGEARAAGARVAGNYRKLTQTVSVDPKQLSRKQPNTTHHRETGTRRKCYAPGHRATKSGKSSPGQCALSSGSSQHVGQSLPSLQPKGSHHVLERLSHSQQWSVLSQYAPSLQSEWESQATGVIVELPVPAPKAVSYAWRNRSQWHPAFRD